VAWRAEGYRAVVGAAMVGLCSLTVYDEGFAYTVARAGAGTPDIGARVPWAAVVGWALFARANPDARTLQIEVVFVHPTGSQQTIHYKGRAEHAYRLTSTAALLVPEKVYSM
jgi:hypothetical protein